MLTCMQPTRLPPQKRKMLLLIDNYDSFTYNLAQIFGELGADVVVKRNDEFALEDIQTLHPARICISPGPGRPHDAGISCDVIRDFGAQIPLLGVCLGHQCIAEVFGGEIVRAANLMHGKTSAISHRGTGVFENLAKPLKRRVIIHWWSSAKHFRSRSLSPPNPMMGKLWDYSIANFRFTVYSFIRNRF